MSRSAFLVLTLLLTACESVAPALYRTPSRDPEPAAPVSWKGTVEGTTRECTTVSFVLSQTNRLLEGWMTAGDGSQTLNEIRGTIENTDVQVAVDRTLWTGRREGDQITLQEPSGCQRKIVLTQTDSLPQADP